MYCTVYIQICFILVMPKEKTFLCNIFNHSNISSLNISITHTESFNYNHKQTPGLRETMKNKENLLYKSHKQIFL